MIAKLGPLVTQAAGSIGGTTFQRGRSGLLIRSKPLPTFRNTVYASSARQRTATLNTLWSTLTPTQVLDWDNFAKAQSFRNRFGDVVVGTAYMAFMKCNQASYHSASNYDPKAIQSTPPTTTAATLPPAAEFILDTGTNTLTVDSSAATVDAATDLALFASRPRRPRNSGDRPRVNDGKFLQIGAAGDTFPIDITAAYVANFGRLPDPTVFEAALLRIRAYDESSMWPGQTVTVNLTVL